MCGMKSGVCGMVEMMEMMEMMRKTGEMNE